MPFSEVVIRAPAKINLGLEVLRRRADGYHEIATLFQAVSLWDRIRLRRRSAGIRLVCTGLDIGDEENLAWRAADLLLREEEVRGGIEITLRKGIPAGGGLGGGSSDAAAVLLGACRLFGLHPPPGTLASWAGRLGSDVPFFLRSGTAVGKGRGEVIEPLGKGGPAAGVLIYIPSFQSPTAEVYAAWRRRRLTRSGDRLTMLVRRWKKGETAALGRALFNDLEDPVLRRHPELVEVKRSLGRHGAAGAQVSGSGSCLFGIFPSPAEATRAAGSLRKEVPGRIRTARFLGPRLRWGVVKR